MKRAARQKIGSVVFDRRRKIWNFLWWDGGKRVTKQIGAAKQYPSKASAWKAARAFHTAAQDQASGIPIVKALVEQYRVEKMPDRSDTRRAYEVWLKNHILPKWGDSPITNLQARPVELWLQSLELAPKSKAHIRGLISILWDFAAWRGEVAIQRNPMELVTIKGSTKRTRRPRTLTVEEFQRFVYHLEEPFQTVALMCCCLGLRISECLALRWEDVDWINSTLRVERGIVCQQVDDVKTNESRRYLAIDTELLERLKAWKQTTTFSTAGDWIFASPV